MKCFNVSPFTDLKPVLLHMYFITSTLSASLYLHKIWKFSAWNLGNDETENLLATFTFMPSNCITRCRHKTTIGRISLTLASSHSTFTFFSERHFPDQVHLIYYYGFSHLLFQIHKLVKMNLYIIRHRNQQKLPLFPMGFDANVFGREECFPF